MTHHHRMRASEVPPYAQATVLAGLLEQYDNMVSCLAHVLSTLLSGLPIVQFTYIADPLRDVQRLFRKISQAHLSKLQGGHPGLAEKIAAGSIGNSFWFWCRKLPHLIYLGEEWREEEILCHTQKGNIVAIFQASSMKGRMAMFQSPPFGGL